VLFFAAEILIGTLVFNCDAISPPAGKARLPEKSAPQISRCAGSPQELID
jgi:hypothetical protein